MQRGAFGLAVGNTDEMGDKDPFNVSLQTQLRYNHLLIAQSNLVLSVFSPVLIPIASLSTLYLNFLIFSESWEEHLPFLLLHGHGLALREGRVGFQPRGSCPALNLTFWGELLVVLGQSRGEPGNFPSLEVSRAGLDGAGRVSLPVSGVEQDF